MDAIPGLNAGPQRHVPEFCPAVPAADFGPPVRPHRAFGWLDLLARSNDSMSLQSFCDLRPVPGGMSKWLKKLETMTPEQVWSRLVQCGTRRRDPGRIGTRWTKA